MRGITPPLGTELARPGRMETVYSQRLLWSGEVGPMAQATLPKMWRDSHPVAQPSATRVRSQPTAPVGTGVQTNWKAVYLHLTFWTLVAVGYVAVCGVVSELDAVRYRLLQEIAVERGQQARLVREINARASYSSLESVIENHNLTQAPADVLRVPAPHALPAEVSTVLLTPQPYGSNVSQPMKQTPPPPQSINAGMSYLP
ncbi:MAG: hypothetical protein N2512_06975 [Armatimonadetes bacterium]|nr:hypothetical protein [Armatimonadota bacterium]